jgi:hypothetical protein
MAALDQKASLHVSLVIHRLADQKAVMTEKVVVTVEFRQVERCALWV